MQTCEPHEMRCKREESDNQVGRVCYRKLVTCRQEIVKTIKYGEKQEKNRVECTMQKYKNENDFVSLRLMSAWRVIVYGDMEVEWSEWRKNPSISRRCCTELISQINVSSLDVAMNFDELDTGYKYEIGMP